MSSYKHIPARDTKQQPLVLPKEMGDQVSILLQRSLNTVSWLLEHGKRESIKLQAAKLVMEMYKGLQETLEERAQQQLDELPSEQLVMQIMQHALRQFGEDTMLKMVAEIRRAQVNHSPKVPVVVDIPTLLDDPDEQ